MEDMLGFFICLGLPILFAAMIMWLDVMTQCTPINLITAEDLRKKNIMQSDIKRKKESCPKCDGSTRYRMAVHGVDESYLFFCDRCKLHFEYVYWHRIGDFRRHLRIDALCPECKKEHKPAVIGDIDTDRIPCEPCWDKGQAEPESKTILIPPARTWRERKRRSWNPWIV